MKRPGDAVPPRLEPFLGLLLSASACAPDPPRFLATSSPIAVGAGLQMCVAVDPTDPAGVWWWQPGRSGCATRSTGPEVFRGMNAAVQARPDSGVVEARFRVGLIRMPDSPLPDAIEVLLAVGDGYVASASTGARVAIARRRDLEIPEKP